MKRIINAMLAIVVSVLIVTTFQFYWNTFLAPAVGWKALGWVSAAGISILMQIPFVTTLSKLAVNTATGPDDIDRNLTITIACLFVFGAVLVVGWVLSLFL